MSVPVLQFENVLCPAGPEGLNLSVSERAIYLACGPQGCGKSDLINLATGIRRPVAGRVRQFGIDLEQAPLDAKRVGIVFSEPSLTPELSLARNLGFFGQLFGMFGRRLRSRTAEVLSLCGLSDRKNMRVDRLSSAERARAEIARALLHQPKLLLLDDPARGLGGDVRSQTARDLCHAGAFDDVAVVWTSRDGAEGAIADEVLRLPSPGGPQGA